MSNQEKSITRIHVETQSSNPADVAKQLRDDAPDQEKCAEFVNRLGEASNNIDAKVS